MKTQSRVVVIGGGVVGVGALYHLVKKGWSDVVLAAGPGHGAPGARRARTELEVEIHGARHPATVIVESPYDPDNERLRG